MNKPVLKKVFIKILIALLVLISLRFLVTWFYVSPVLLNSKAVGYIRHKIDIVLHEAFLSNTLGFRDTATKYSPWMTVWRPPRIIPDMELPESFEGDTEFNAIFGQVTDWRSEKGLLEIKPFSYALNYSQLYIDVNSAKIIIPKFDSTSQPMPVPKPDPSFVTSKQLRIFSSSFESPAEEAAFRSNFDSTTNLNAFITTYFNGLDSRLQLFDFTGPYTWESAFCVEDIVILGFDKEVDLTNLEPTEYPVADVVLVNVSSCPVIYSNGGGTK